jgi:hypothetical protein
MAAQGIGGISGPSVRPGHPEGQTQPRVDGSPRQPGSPTERW